MFQLTTLVFSEDFSIESGSGSGCPFDVLTVHEDSIDGTTLLSACGYRAPDTIQSYHTLVVRFTTDESYDTTGFQITYSKN